MWKKEDGKSPATQDISTTHGVPASPSPAPTPSFSSSRESSAPSLGTNSSASRGEACISQGIRIRGEVTGSEDLFVDGQVEGKLSLTNGSLTIGPHGHVKADVTAREVIVRGSVEGKVSGRDKVLLGSTGQVNGEVQTDRLAIEDGAMLRGRVEAGRKPKTSSEGQPVAASAAASGNKGGSTVSTGSGTVAI